MSLQLLDASTRASSVFQLGGDEGGAHEQVVYCRDDRSGLRAIIAIHSTSRGPALGGTRFYPYPSETAALTDALRLSQGMTFKAAAAGLPLGGGKAVIIGDPATLKTPDLLAAYGGFVDRLGGTYVTAADVGTTAEDLDVIAARTRHVVGCSTSIGGSGDSGFSTAYGVLTAMRAAAAAVWGATGIHGRSVGVEGVGKVGARLVGLLLDEGARVVVSDRDEAALRRLTARHNQVLVVDEVRTADVDIYAPCALGATLTPTTVRSLRARLVCGAANNQLSDPGVDQLLTQRDILWVPDFVANAGGLIQVGGELRNVSERDVTTAIEAIGVTVFEIVDSAQRRRKPMGEAAMDVVAARLRFPTR